MEPIPDDSFKFPARLKTRKEASIQTSGVLGLRTVCTGLKNLKTALSWAGVGWGKGKPYTSSINFTNLSP